jgi:hypothetical protein
MTNTTNTLATSISLYIRILTYNDFPVMPKTLNVMPQGTIFSGNSQCKWCFDEIYWLAIDLSCSVETEGFQWWVSFKGGGGGVNTRYDI